MALIDIEAPSPGESITEVQIAVWLKPDGAMVAQDETLCEIESDKATLTVAAPAAGRLQITAQPGEVVAVGHVIGRIDPEGKAATPAAPRPSAAPPPAAPSTPPTPTTTAAAPQTTPTPAASAWAGTRPVRRERLSMLRRSLADRLVAVKNQTAMLTTFNEVDMSFVQALRAKQQSAFQTKYGVKLGLMSFFARAVVQALKEFPAVNSQIDGEELVAHDYVDLGIAVSTPKGLMVPVIRDAQTRDAGGMEQAIAALAEKARAGKITIDELSGGTFTITNGGVFGSMLSTPILNPPQSGILGMHNIVERPIAVNGQVVIRPIMYVALSYDHRIIDGRESVGFLKRVKEQLETPEALLAGAL